MDVHMPHSNAIAPSVLLTLLSCCAADGKQRSAGPVSQQQHALQQLLRHAVIATEVSAATSYWFLVLCIAQQLAERC